MIIVVMNATVMAIRIEARPAIPRSPDERRAMSKPNPRSTIEAGNIESIAYFLSLDSIAMNEANVKPSKKPRVPAPRENISRASRRESIKIASSETIVIANTERVRINDSPGRLLIVLIIHSAQELR